MTQSKYAPVPGIPDSYKRICCKARKIKHSPAPFYAVGPEIRDKNNKNIALVSRFNINRQGRFLQKEKPEFQANMALFIAAPEMLTVLEQVDETFNVYFGIGNFDEPGSPDHEAVRQVITKAKGGVQ